MNPLTKGHPFKWRCIYPKFGIDSRTCVWDWLWCFCRSTPLAMCWGRSGQQRQWSMSPSPSSELASTALQVVAAYLTCSYTYLSLSPSSLTKRQSWHDECIAIEQRWGSPRHLSTALQKQPFLLLGQLPASRRRAVVRVLLWRHLLATPLEASLLVVKLENKLLCQRVRKEKRVVSTWHHVTRNYVIKKVNRKIMDNIWSCYTTSVFSWSSLSCFYCYVSSMACPLRHSLTNPQNLHCLIPVHWNQNPLTWNENLNSSR